LAFLKKVIAFRSSIFPILLLTQFMQKSIRFSTKCLLVAGLLLATLSVSAQVDHDECDNALPLPIDTELNCSVTFSGSTDGATQSLPDCNGSLSNDIWYQFTATTTSYQFNPGVISFGAGEWGYEFFSGDCDNLSSIRCEQFQESHPGVSTQDGFTPGNTYYLRHQTTNAPARFLWGSKPISFVS